MQTTNLCPYRIVCHIQKHYINFLMIEASERESKMQNSTCSRASKTSSMVIIPMTSSSKLLGSDSKSLADMISPPCCHILYCGWKLLSCLMTLFSVALWISVSLEYKGDASVEKLNCSFSASGKISPVQFQIQKFIWNSSFIFHFCQLSSMKIF